MTEQHDGGEAHPDAGSDGEPRVGNGSIDRRMVAASIAALAGGLSWPARAIFRGQGWRSTQALTLLEARVGGRLGVHALDMATGRTLSHRAGERFKLMSTFKCLLTAMVLREVDEGRERLGAAVPFGPADLMDASPVTTANVAAGRMSVGKLCEATMTRSDNAAANLLMRRLGGPPALTSFLRTIGDRVTGIDHYEGAALMAAPASDDSSTPMKVVADMRRILLGPVLSAAARKRWRTWMIGNRVGDHRLRAAFPAGWEVGDRTGTANGICNDVAFALRPGGAMLLIAAYHQAPGMEIARQEALLRDVGRVVIAWHGR